MLTNKAAKAAAEADAAKKRMQQAESDRKKLELEVDSLKERIGKLRTQQNDTRSNDQYKAFQHQIETYETEIHQIEDRELELMELFETSSKASAAAAKVSSEVKAETDRHLKELTARDANLSAEVESVTDARETVADEVDEMSLAKYERVLKTRGDNAVVGVAKGICGGCHVRLTHQAFISAKAQQELVTCTNCGRILYFTPDMEYARDGGE